MISIRLIFGHQEFDLTQTRDDKFRFISADRTRLANTLAEGINFAHFEVELRAKQIREYNAEFPEDEPISLFQIPREIEGEVNLDRMEFNCGVYAGDTPYTAENFEF
jgi:hypothetical protein